MNVSDTLFRSFLDWLACNVLSAKLDDSKFATEHKIKAGKTFDLEIPASGYGMRAKLIAEP